MYSKYIFPLVTVLAVGSYGLYSLVKRYSSNSNDSDTNNSNNDNDDNNNNNSNNNNSSQNNNNNNIINNNIINNNNNNNNNNNSNNSNNSNNDDSSNSESGTQLSKFEKVRRKREQQHEVLNSTLNNFIFGTEPPSPDRFMPSTSASTSASSVSLPNPFMGPNTGEQFGPNPFVPLNPLNPFPAQ